MVKDVYTGLKQFQDIGGDLIERIKSMGLQEVFSPLIEEYGSDEMLQFNTVLFYLLNCYSRQSDYLILDAEWEFIKMEAAKDAGLDLESELYTDLYYLKNNNFNRTVRKYLDYQNSKPFKHLIMLKDLYEQMVNSAIENITDKDEKTNYDQKKKNAEHAAKLYHEINEWEQRIEMDNIRLKKPVDEFKEKEKKKDGLTLRLEENLG